MTQNTNARITMDAFNFPRKLIRLRTINHLTQLDLAQLMGIRPETISRWERGISLPRMEQVMKLSSLFGAEILMDDPPILP